MPASNFIAKNMGTKPHTLMLEIGFSAHLQTLPRKSNSHYLKKLVLTLIIRK